MFAFDSLLIASLRFVLDKIVRAAEAEAHDGSALRERLLDAEMRLELGEITHDELVEIEREVFAALRRIKGAAQGPISMSPDKQAGGGVEIESFDAGR